MTLEEVVDYIPDRPFNDGRYAILSDKVHALGWDTKRTLEEDLPAVVQWYKEHARRYPEF
jgi:dTDP-D-glucose 4,6-dehydratase